MIDGVCTLPTGMPGVEFGVDLGCAASSEVRLTGGPLSGPGGSVWKVPVFPAGLPCFDRFVGVYVEVAQVGRMHCNPPLHPPPRHPVYAIKLHVKCKQ